MCLHGRSSCCMRLLFLQTAFDVQKHFRSVTNHWILHVSFHFIKIWINTKWSTLNDVWCWIKLQVIYVYTHTHTCPGSAILWGTGSLREYWNVWSSLSSHWLCSRGRSSSTMTCNYSNLHVTDTILITQCHDWDWMTVFRLEY